MEDFWNWIRNTSTHFKELSYLSFAGIATNAIGGVFWIYMASLLGAENYGEINYYIGVALVVSSITLFGASNTLIVFGAKGKKIQPIVNFISVFSSIAAAIILFVIFGNLGVSFYTVGFVIFTLTTSDLLGLKLYRNYSIYLIVQRVIMVGLTLLFYYTLGSDGVILGIALSFFFVIPKIYTELKKPFDVKFYRSKINFVLNNYAIDISNLFRGYVDKLLIAPMLGFALLGNYQLSIQFIAIISIIPNVMYQYILPREASGIKNNKIKIVAIIISVILAIIGYLLSPVVLPIIFPKFVEAVQIIQIMSFSIIPGVINMMFIVTYLSKEKPKYLVIGSAIFLTTQIIGIIVLGKLFGIFGVAGSMVIALSLETVYFFMITKINLR